MQLRYNNLSYLSLLNQANVNQKSKNNIVTNNGVKPFDLNIIGSRLDNNDTSVLNELSANSFKYTYNKTSYGYYFECNYNGKKYVIDKAIKPNNTNQSTISNVVWSLSAIKKEGIDINKSRKYFIYINANSYRFNPEGIREDFGSVNISKLSDLKAAIDNLNKKSNSNNSYKANNIISADTILKKLNNMQSSSNTGQRLLVQMMNSTFKKYGCNDDKSKKKLLKYLAQLLNTQLKINIDNKFDFSNELVDKILTKSGLVTLQNALNSQALKNLYTVDIDGVIDDFKQRADGDCWLLSGIMSINSTDKGKDYIKNSIQWNSNFTELTVYFSGVDKKVTISASELIKKDPDSSYASGDNDVLAIEIAYEKLFGSKGASLKATNLKDYFTDNITAGAARTFWKAFLPNVSVNTCPNLNDINVYSLQSQMKSLAMSGGGKIDLTKGHVEEYLKEMLNAKKSGANITMSFTLASVAGPNFKGFTWNTVDGLKGECKVSAHVFAITDITENTVTFVNPWDSSRPYKVSWAEFAKIGIALIEWGTIN